jgi:mono/diheme cytochrome c family protein
MKSFVSATQPKLDNHPPRVAPASAPTVERGQYLARSVANCGGCHTEFNPMTGATIVPLFSGGGEMESTRRKGADPRIGYRPPNITPRVGSALTKFPDRDTFVARFKVGGRQHAGSPMPWEAFSRMTPEDIGAIYEYLKTVPAAGEPSIGEPTVKH